MHKRQCAGVTSAQMPPGVGAKKKNPKKGKNKEADTISIWLSSPGHEQSTSNSLCIYY